MRGLAILLFLSATVALASTLFWMRGPGANLHRGAQLFLVIAIAAVGGRVLKQISVWRKAQHDAVLDIVESVSCGDYLMTHSLKPAVSISMVAGIGIFLLARLSQAGADPLVDARAKALAPETRAERGSVKIPGGIDNDVATVYYRVPFATPPNLTIDSAQQEYSILEQKADHFRIKNLFRARNEIAYTAQGFPAPSGPKADTIVIPPNWAAEEILFASLTGQVVGLHLAPAGYLVTLPGEPKDQPASFIYRGDFKVVRTGSSCLVLESVKGDQEVRIPARSLISVAVKKK